MAYKLFLKNDNVLSCAVSFADDSAASTAATVSAVVTKRESTGDVIETGLTMQQDDTDGTYERLLDETQYENGRWYTAEVTVSSSDGADGYVELDFQAKKRRVN